MFLLKRFTSASATFLLFFSATVQAQEQSCNAKQACWIAPNDIFIYIILFIVIFGTLMAILVIRRSLPKEWSLADALSEDVELPVINEGDTGTKVSIDDTTGKPVLVPVMKASSSRLIALMGMLVILFMFIGFGSLILYSFGQTGIVPESVGSVIKFLAAGMTLFTPYAVNKLSSFFQGVTSNK
ncbi:hypothetical protein [Serratia plymuthica]|uniref:hypothetical protein n=1 Tax=Serratia plymuthica TaxID=82996 RepID=UPI0018D7E279|nr:hypothetical protein [Serratia plymuthica]QPS57639.1 hypothetical protein I6G53_09110 [Serratia plymuthica]CAI1538602.1 Uncharacterised protein [Serratia plymuthica]